jgi:hypothetical protein
MRLRDGLAVGALIGGVMAARRLQRRRGREPVAARLWRFFGQDPARLTVVSCSLSAVEAPSVHRAIESWAQEHSAQLDIVGYQSTGLLDSSLRTLLFSVPFFAPHTSAVAYEDVAVGYGETVACPTHALYLLTAGRTRAVVRVFSAHGHSQLEVMADPGAAGKPLLDALRALAMHHCVYRGKLLSFDCQAGLRFQRVEPVPTEAVILPDETKAMLTRNTVGFFQHAEALRRAGRAVKRGLLLHGPPGTGKTYSAMWLAGQMTGVTVFLETAEQLAAIKQVCQMARLLAPSLVILEDVDLIAAPREAGRDPGEQVFLHQLLNEMDGMAPDAAVMFLLTTNRPEAIETALAARPGRVDQAIAYPLPDAEGRRRLLALFGQGLELQLDDEPALIARLQGASPAFIKELVRKAAQFALDEDGETSPLRLDDGHFDAAIGELLLGAGAFSRQLLGFPEVGAEG